MLGKYLIDLFVIQLIKIELKLCVIDGNRFKKQNMGSYFLKFPRGSQKFFVYGNLVYLLTFCF